MISVNIIARDEEKNISECVQSVSWADEIILIDGESTDRTAELASAAGARVVVNKWEGYAAQRQFALTQAAGEWVFVLDADERCTAELKQEILNVVKNTQNEYAGFRIPRKSFCLGRWIKHCGWYPGYQTRLFKRSAVHVTDRLVHEGYEITGKLGFFTSDILHYTLPSIKWFMHKVNSFAYLQAQEKQHRKKVGFLDVFLRPIATFLRSYILQRGFLDGIPGLIVCFFDTITNMLTYMTIWELQHKIEQKEK